MMSRMHLTGGRISLILPYIAWQIPFSMYIIKQYFETIPEELIDPNEIAEHKANVIDTFNEIFAEVQ